MTGAFPIDAADLTVDRLNSLVQTVHKDAKVKSFEVLSAKSFEDGNDDVSTAGRIELEIVVAEGAARDLSGNAVIKVCRPDIAASAIYRNEVRFYTRLRGELDIEAPRCLGGEFDEATGTFGLALEDIRDRGATFPNVKTAVSLDQMRSLLDVLAKLHAAYWESPRFVSDLAWVEPHTRGSIYEMFNNPGMVPALIDHEIQTQQFKRELVQSIGKTAQQLYQEFRKLQNHQAGLPQTICHGDTHIGNTYLLPGGKGGLIDWQLMARGYCMHDVTYLLITGLPVEQRRQQERALIQYYLDRLVHYGVRNAPDVDTVWLEYRRAAVWGVYIGWLTTPIENYGWDICVCNHVRLITAYRDLGTSDAIADLPDVDDW